MAYIIQPFGILNDMFQIYEIILKSYCKISWPSTMLATIHKGTKPVWMMNGSDRMWIQLQLQAKHQLNSNNPALNPSSNAHGCWCSGTNELW
jgi:hypothetical protein